MKELKDNKKNIKYVFLHAAGGEGLIELYQKIGFEYNITITKKLDYFVYDVPNIMFGKIDVILEKLREKLKSNCDNKEITPLT